MKKFDTIYRHARTYSIKYAKHFNANTTVEFERFIYQIFKNAAQLEYNITSDTNTWVFDQNELKSWHNGKQTLRTLCKTYYIEVDAAETTMYMHIHTGQIGTYDEWAYTNNDGVELNAVYLKEVVEVHRNAEGNWVEV